MNDDSLPVADDEYILRRIHRSAYCADAAPPVLRIAFQPNENDTSGLSVFRERFVTAAQTLAAIPTEKRHLYFVARLAVSDLRQCGLSVVAEPDAAGPRGHAVIPELSWPAFQSDKQRSKVIQLELAMMASAALVLRPAPLP